jgi:hypothetical protein
MAFRSHARTVYPGARAVLILALILMFAGCQTTPSLAPAETAIAQTETLAVSATQDAEHLLEVAEKTGDEEVIYIAKKHVTEVKAIAAKSVEAKKAAEEVRSVAETVAEAKVETAQVKAKYYKLLAGVIAAVVIVAAAIVIKIRLKI